MLLLSVVYDQQRIDIAEEISELKSFLVSKNVTIDVKKSFLDNTHFLKIYCDDNEFSDRLLKTFNIYIANIIYNIVIDEFYKKEMQLFLADTYFFLKYDEIDEIRELSLKALKSDKALSADELVYCINKKNTIIDKIIECIEENKEINIKGFITFRMKELREDLENIIDKVVETYMVEKEYNEFIKLLKYFVDIQESKIEEINILIKQDGSYLVQDSNGEDILSKITSELSEARFTSTVSIEDMLISGLITNAPQRIIVHCSDNCLNKELIDTVQNVFTDRVSFCDSCKACKSIKHSIKV